MPTQTRLQQLFDYKDGQLINKSRRRWNEPGSSVGFWNESYFKCNVDGKRLAVHRVVWAWHYGEIPEGYDIDHIDRDRRNNRIENLRLATRSENLKNREYKKMVPREVKGLSYMAFEKRWRASIPLPGGKRIYLGTSRDKHRILWLLHMYQAGLYKPGATIKTDALNIGGSNAVSGFCTNQEPDDVWLSHRQVATELETFGVAVEGYMPRVQL